MSLELRVEIGAKQHREDLKAFPCCVHRQVYGRRRTECAEPWSHPIQYHIRTSVLSWNSGADGRRADHRLLLLYDGDVLAGVGGHQLVQPADDERWASREIEFAAVRTELRGTTLSDGSRCSDAILSVVVADAVKREPKLTHMRTEVHCDNGPSLGLVRRHSGLIEEAVGDVHPVLIPVR